MLRGHVRPDLLREECLGDILRATAGRRPDHAALIWGERVVSYAELDALSDAVAGKLVARGASPGAVIGLQMPRGADLLIAQAGIAKSGAAWLPLDATTPGCRVEQCLRAAGACGLIAPREWTANRTHHAPRDGYVWAIEDLLAHAGMKSCQPPPDRARPTDPAYTIYTSGSTGQPKGIVVTHRSICHFLRSENEVLGIREEDMVYQGFSVAFDMSFEEIWISYLVGATLCIAPPECVADPEQIAAAVARQRISVIHAVPTLMSLIDDPLPSVRLINLGGEVCPQALVDRLARPGRKVFNTYGPTEATVSATLARLQPGLPVTIGEPLPNYGLLVVDDELRPLPLGETGEICIFGPGVAVGYLGQPELTAQRFVANPLAIDGDDARMYRTGDLGRIDTAGQLHYLGRADDQVKIRGFRVELGEIEGAIAAEPGIAAVAVTLRPLAGIEQLVAFVAAASGSPPPPADLRKALGRAPAKLHGAGPFRVRRGTAAIDVRQGEPEGFGRFAIERDAPARPPAGHRASRRGRRGLVRGPADAFSRPTVARRPGFLRRPGRPFAAGCPAGIDTAGRSALRLAEHPGHLSPAAPATDRRTDGATEAEARQRGAGCQPARRAADWQSAPRGSAKPRAVDAAVALRRDAGGW